MVLPYAPPTAPRVRDALTDLLERIRRDGYPMKVGPIQSAGDLGEEARLAGRPLEYANLLTEELRTVRHGSQRSPDRHPA